MRITFIIPFPNLSGGIRIIANLASGLRQFGHSVTVVAQPAPEVPLLRRLRSKFDSRVWLPLTQQGPYFDGTGITPRFLERRRPVTDSDVPDADVVIATWWETAEWVSQLSPAKGVKCHFIQQYEANFGAPEDRVASVWQLPYHKIVCSKWLADLARDRFGDATASVVPNGIDVELFNAPSRGRQAVPTVGFMYAADHVKGCDVTLEAIRAATNALPELRVSAFGMREPSDELPLPAGVTYTVRPPQQLLKSIYASCDVWICGSRSEGFHLPPHEAMACRCPVVSTRVGGPMDMVVDGINGFLVDVDDKASLSAKLVTVLKMPDHQWRAMSDAAYETARGFTWVAACARFESALEAALGRHSQRIDGPALQTT